MTVSVFILVSIPEVTMFLYFRKLVPRTEKEVLRKIHDNYMLNDDVLRMINWHYLRLHVGHREVLDLWVKGEGPHSDTVNADSENGLYREPVCLDGVRSNMDEGPPSGVSCCLGKPLMLSIEVTKLNQSEKSQ